MNIIDVLFAKKLSGGGSPFPPVIKRVTGNPIEFEDGADAPLVKCVTQITGSQDLHGYDKPWVGGAGRNKMPASLAGSTSINGITIISDGNGTYTINGTATAQTTIDFDLITSYVIPIAQSRGGNGCFNLCNSFTAQASLRLYIDSTQVDSWSLNSVNKYSSTYSSMGGKTINKISFIIANGETINGTVSPMFTEDGTSTYSAFAPYSNICPITAYTEGEIEVSDGDGNVTTHTTTYPSAIYRGSEDCVNGEVTSEMPVIDLGDLTWTLSGNVWYAAVNGLKRPAQTGYKLNAICSSYEIVAQAMAPQATHVCMSGLNWIDGIALWKSGFETAQEVKESVTGVKFAYLLATPTTSSVTPTNLPIKSLSGYNHIESSTGEMTIDYITEGYQNFVDTVESALPSNTRNLLTASKGGTKAMDIFLSLEKRDDKEEEVKEATEEKSENER